MSDRHLWARDYTDIVRHQGKMFTVNDLSLAWMGGLSFPATRRAAVFVAPIWLATQLLLGWLGPVPWWAILGVMAVLWMGGLSFPATRRAAVFVAPIWLATQLLLGWLGPVPWWAILGVMAVLFVGLYAFFQRDLGDRESPSRRMMLWLSLRRHQPEHIASTAADTSIDTMHWCAIVMRPNHSAHIKAGRSLGNREQYRPAPRRSAEFEVVDDFDLFDRWHAAMIAATNTSPFAASNTDRRSS